MVLVVSGCDDLDVVRLEVEVELALELGELARAAKLGVSFLLAAPIIAGAGVGGLTAAVALARAGLRVTILERAPVLGEVGAGLQLAPNATSCLARLGLLERVSPFASTPEHLRIRRGRDGEELARVPLGVIADARWGAPWFVIHRADLQRALVEACASERAIALRTGLAVVIYPLQKAAGAPVEWLGSIGDYFTSLSATQRENEALRTRVLQNARDVLTLEALAAENAQLRRLQEARERVAGGATLAEVLYAGRDPFSRRIEIGRAHV